MTKHHSGLAQTGVWELEPGLPGIGRGPRPTLVAEVQAAVGVTEAHSRKRVCDKPKPRIAA